MSSLIRAHKSVIFVFVILFSLPSRGQTIITGSVEGPGGTGPLEYASVIASNGRKICGFGVSDENGTFSLRLYEEGKYSISILYTGYESRVIDIAYKEGELNLGRITLCESKDQITEAKIISRSLFKRESDRLVYDVASDPESRRVNMSEFMSKIPGLKISSSSGKLEFKDIPISTIEIDGKRNVVINARRQYPMEFIKADYMKTIELVLPGSPEYANSSPILLIKLKKELPYGFASEFSSAASSLNSDSVSSDIVANTRHISAGLNYKYSFDHNPELTTATERSLLNNDFSNPTSSSFTNTSKRNKNTSHNLLIDLSKDCCNNKLNFQGMLNTKREDAIKNIVSTCNGVPTFTKETGSTPSSFGAGILATYAWDRRNKLTFRYTGINEVEEGIQEIQNKLWSDARRNISSIKRVENNVSTLLMFSDRSSNHKWMSTFEAGMMTRDYFEDVCYWDGGTGGLDYDQTVSFLNARYMSSALDHKITYSLSIRGEYAITDEKGIFSLSPSAAAAFLIGGSNHLTLGYGCLSKRPQLKYLLSFSDFSDPNNITTGNPLLGMQTTHSLNLSDCHTPKIGWIGDCKLSLNYSITPGAIDYIESVTNDNIAITTAVNLESRKDFRIEPDIVFKLSKNTSLNISAFVRNSSYTIDSGNTNSFWTYGCNQSCNIRCKLFDIRETFTLQPYAASAQTFSFTTKPELSVTISKYWKKLNLGGSLSFNDIVSNRSFIETEYRTINAEQHTFNQIYGRYVSVRMYWRIGHFKQHSSIGHSSYDM